MTTTTIKAAAGKSGAPRARIRRVYLHHHHHHHHRVVLTLSK
jgi:hypothetical protein